MELGRLGVSASDLWLPAVIVVIGWAGWAVLTSILREREVASAPAHQKPPQVDTIVEDDTSVVRERSRAFGRQVLQASAHWRSRFALDISAGFRFAVGVSIGALAIVTFADMAHDFYTLMRIVVCVTCAALLHGLWKQGAIGGWFWLLLAIAVLYNPLLPMRLHKDTWAILNVATIPALALLVVCIKPSGRDASVTGTNGS